MKRKLIKFTALTLVLALMVLLLPPMQVAQASAISVASNTMSRQRISVLSNHEIRFRTPTATVTGSTITVTFPAGFGMGTHALANFDLAATAAGADCAIPGNYTERALAATQTGTTWGVSQSLQVVTFVSGDTTSVVPANACVRIRIGSNAVFPTTTTGVDQITNPGTAGSYTITIGGTFGSSGPITVQILADDQVAVTADVAQTISFTISHPTIHFGTLSAAAARFATNVAGGSGTETEAHTLVASTNAGSGYVINVSGTTLTFGTHTITNIGATNVASAPGTEQYGIRANVTGAGIGTVSAPYAATGFALVLTANEFAAATGASAANTFSVRYLANIAATTEAGAYTSTLTYVATARF